MKEGFLLLLDTVRRQEISMPATEELVDTLRHELEMRNQEINRLHDVIAQQAQAIDRPLPPLE